MSIGHKLGLRLFLEGIEVPVISASISVVPDSPAAASIQIIATDTATEIMPRTMVHLFFYDFVNATSVVTTARQFEQQNYKLLFMGEVQGIQFQKDTTNRNMILSCVDFSNYWDTTYQYNFQGSLIGGRRQAAFIGANANYFTGPLGHGTGSISRLLTSRSVNFPKLQGLLGGIIRVLEAVGGAYYGRDTFRGANDFTAIAELRCKLLQQICAAEKDTSTARLFSRKTFNMWMNRECGSLGKLVTFRGLCQLMEGFIYHETFPNPAAKYEPAQKDIPDRKTVAMMLKDDPRSAVFIQAVLRLSQLNGAAVAAIVDIGAEGALESHCSKLSENVSYMYTVLGEMQLTVPNISGLDLPAEVNTINTNLNDLNKYVGTSSTPFKLDRTRIATQGKSVDALNCLRNINVVIRNILAKHSTHTYDTTYDKQERVNNQIFRPDVWYAPAPRCNVLFPELYSSVSWSRNFLREITRVELQTTNEILGDEAIFNGRYYAPNVEDMRKGLKLQSRQFFGLVMQHELLTGIIPMYDKMTQANLYSMKAAGIKGKAAKVSYAQRAVNHQYFKHRFSTRQMQVTGRFNPWFVPGFPGVVIDRPMTEDKLRLTVGLPNALNAWWKREYGDTGASKLSRSEIMRALVGPQFVGSCVQLEHSVTQQGGTTSYVFGQARVHRESVEYLGVDKVKISEKVGIATRVYKAVAHPDTPPKIGGKGVYGGKITKVTDITKSSPGQILHVWPLMKEYREVGADIDTTMCLLPAQTDIWDEPASANSNEYTGVDSWGAPQMSVIAPETAKTNVWRGFEVVESADVRQQRLDDLPIEEAIRPPWIWEGWNNLNIGATYNQFFGTNSITDIEGLLSEDRIRYTDLDEQQVLWETKRGLADGTGRGFSKTSYGYEAPSPIPTSPRDKKRLRNAPAPAAISPPPLAEQADKALSSSTAYVLDKERTIEASIDALTRVYSLVRSGNLDVGLFIRNYTWRPIATMVEILGTYDLLYAEDKQGHVTVKEGKEGFHSRAYGNVANLFGLANPKVRKVLGLSPDKDNATAMRLDVRKMRWLVIKKYYEELMASRGLLG